MATASEYVKTALIMGILSTAEERRKELFEMLVSAFGPIAQISETMDFPYTDYYDREMGKRPVRYILMFQNLIDPSKLADIKTRTNEMEKLFATPTGRTINLDPGTLSLANLILATCKDRSHRIPLGKGIYGEVTLIYQDHDFQSLPWTYADYSSESVKSVLRAFRTQYRRML